MSKAEEHLVTLQPCLSTPLGSFKSFAGGQIQRGKGT